MAQKSHMNVNDVYPILDMINRKVNQGKGTRHHFTSPLFNNDNDNGVTTLNSSQWQVESFEVIRETENSIANHVINEIRIIYRNGAIDKISLVRGLNPPVSDEIQDYEYINNIMITEVSIRTEWFGKSQEVVAKIIRENDYGNFKRLNLRILTRNGAGVRTKLKKILCRLNMKIHLIFITVNIVIMKK